MNVVIKNGRPKKKIAGFHFYSKITLCAKRVTTIELSPSLLRVKEINGYVSKLAVQEVSRPYK